MKKETLSNAIGQIDDGLITAADRARTSTRRKAYRWVSWVALAACLCLLVAGALKWGVPGREPAAGPGSIAAGEMSGTDPEPSTQAGSSPVTLAAAVYPEMEQFPIWEEFGDDDAYDTQYSRWMKDRASRLKQSQGYSDGVADFTGATMAQFLSGADGENRVYSPLSLYFALGMLAELTGGNSRAQVLDLLGVDSAEALREKISALWLANYFDDGAVTSVLANSLWLNQNINYVQSTMDTLAKKYYASSFQGDMASEEYEQLFKDWLNAQTGGLLQEQAEGMDWFKEDTVLALASTIYFRAKWKDAFAESRTEEGIFHAPGGDVSCGFMHQSRAKSCYWGDGFTAVTQPLENSGDMWLILPDEGVSVDELLSDGGFLDMVSAGADWENQKDLTVNLALPKFDVVSDLDLTGGLNALGVTDVFNSGAADFSSMIRDITWDGYMHLSKAQQAARVMVDEEGCIAAAYTVMAVTADSMPPEEEIDFVLDRPFLFVITGADGSPLFVGVVNQPVE